MKKFGKLRFQVRIWPLLKPGETTLENLGGEIKSILLNNTKNEIAISKLIKDAAAIESEDTILYIVKEGDRLTLSLTEPAPVAPLAPNPFARSADKGDTKSSVASQDTASLELSQTAGGSSCPVPPSTSSSTISSDSKKN